MATNELHASEIRPSMWVCRLLIGGSWSQSECQRSREILEATDSRIAWHGTLSARCGLAFSVRLLDQRSNTRLLGLSDCPEPYMARLRASALQQALRIGQARALEMP